jgi:arabinogalactan oligomer/maltooligosaccharide transport system substrate-binding protein
MTMKKWLTAMMIIIFLLLSSCGNQGSPDSKIHLTFWTAASGAEIAFFKDRVKAFEVEHPNIQVKVVQKPLSFVTNEFKTAVLSQQTVDVFRADNTWIPEYADLDIVYPLDTIASKADLSGFGKTTLSAMTYSGHVYGLPSVMEVPALLFNKKMLEEAGFQHPPETMDELMTIAMALTDKDTYGIFLTDDSYFALPYLWAYGGGMVSNDRKIQITSEGSQHGLAFMQQLRRAGVTQPYTDFSGWHNKMMSDFKDGKVAMIINGPWAIQDLLQSKAFPDSNNLGIAPIPRGPQGQGSPIGGHSLIINNYSKYPNESFQLIRYLTSLETQIQQSQKFKTLPTQLAAYEDERITSDSLFEKFKAQLDVAKIPPMIPEGSKLYRDFTNHLNKILLEEESISEGVILIESAWKSLLNIH